MSIPTSDLSQIIQLLQKGDKAEVVSQLRHLLKRNPNNIQALVWLGGLTSHPREGIIALERALRLDPDNERAQQYLERWRSLQVSSQLVADQSDQHFKMLAQRKAHRLALLIDGDNARPTLIDKIMLEAQKYGALTFKRIYGDWTKPAMHRWKRVLHRHAIQPIQQFQYTRGKNATDSALIIDAMDILHAGQVDGFCLVSSDSDYTRLATRITESGLYVMGIGRKRTPSAFVNACDLFVYTETLLAEQTQAEGQKSAKVGRSCAKKKKKDQAADDQEVEITDLLKEAFEQAVQPDGRAYLGTIGLHLQRMQPEFEPRKYGYKQLSHLVRAQGELFETETVSSKIYVKLNGR